MSARVDVPQPPIGTRLDTLVGLWRVLVGWRAIFAASIACNVVAHLAAATAAVLAASAVGGVLLGRDVDLAGHVLGVAGAIVVRGVAAWGESWLSHDVSFRVMARVRGWIVAAIGRIAPAGIARRRVGDVATTALSDAEALEIFLAHSSLYILSAWITTPVLLASAAFASPLASAAMVPFVAIAIVVTRALRARARRTGVAQRAAVAALASEVQEDVGAAREIVADGLVDVRMQRIAALEAELAAAQRSAASRAGAETAVVGVVGVATAAAGAIVGALQASAGALDPALVPVLAALGGAAPSAILQWVGVTRHHGTTSEAARRIEGILEAEAPVDRSGTVVVPDGAAGLAIDEVRFAWPGGDDVLRGVAVDVAAGEIVAICGRSGAGKSTLASLLARHVDPMVGSIRVGGVDVRTLSVDGMADAVGLVPQEAYLFRETVRENLLLAASGDVGDDALWAALAVVGADEVVHRMPGGLDATIDDRGRSLSGGERQRIALARSIVAGARVVVLDESVSQLDVQSEADISAAIAAAGRTGIVIAHRLSTLLRADRIIVLDEGRVAGSGAHPVLLQTCPAYARLVRPQLAALDAS